VPPSVLVDTARILRDARSAAAAALAALERTRRLAGDTEPERAPAKVVAKGPASADARQVCVCDDADALATALRRLAGATRASQILVQEFVPHLFELRVCLLNEKVQQFLYTTFGGGLTEDGRLRELRIMSREAAIREFLEGNEGLMDQVENRAERTMVPLWLDVLRASSAGHARPIPSLRIDFLVARYRTGNSASWRPKLTTNELTEAGFSFLRWKEGASQVFKELAVLCYNAAAE
jgi:hypothetical protein